MKPAPLPATPGLMTLLCIIGGAMRGEGPVGLGMQLLVIGTLVPEFGLLLKTWVRVEEYKAAGHAWCGDAYDEDQDEDGSGGGGSHSGWVRREGPVWLWRHVTLVGVMIIPIRWFVTFRNAELLPRGCDVAPDWSLAAVFFQKFSTPVWDATPNCDLIVPVS